MKDDAIRFWWMTLFFVIMVEAGVILLIYSFVVNPPLIDAQNQAHIAELMRNGEVYLI